MIRTPVWTLSLVLTIALGVASNASIDGFVRGLLRQGPLPAVDAVSVFAGDDQHRAGPVSHHRLTELRSRTDLFLAVGAVRETQEEAWLHKRRLLVSVAWITPAAADLLQLDDDRGIIVSHRFWYQDFVGVPVDGQTMRIGSTDLPVTGVADEWLEGLYRGRAIDLWIRDDSAPADPALANQWVVAQLRDGIAREEAQRAVETVIAPLSIVPYTGLLPDMADSLVRIGRLLRVAAIAVFVIACANVASFLASRAAARTRETAVRVALGARRPQLISQVLADSVLLAGAGAVLGAVLATWLSQIVPAMLFAEDAGQMAFDGDWRTVAAIAVACATVTLVCGLLPLIDTRDDRPGAIIQREGSGPSRLSIRLGAGLVFLQMTTCTLLVISAGVLLSGFRSALQTNQGRRLSHPVLASVEALQTSSKSQEKTAGLEYFERAAQAGRDVLDASSIAWTSSVPGNRPVWQAFAFEAPKPITRPIALQRVSFTTKSVANLILPPIEGRLFGTRDTGSCAGVVVSREAARLLGGENLVGRSIESAAGEWSEIIGVVATADDPLAQRVYHYAPDAIVTDSPPRLATYRFPEPAETAFVLDVHVVSPNYFQVMDLPTTAGRAFTDAADGCRVAVVNRDAADLYFNGDAVGGAIIDRQGRRTSVIGVVGSRRLRAAQRGVTPIVYVPYTQDYQPRVTLIMETRGVDRAAMRRFRGRIAAIPGGRSDRTIITTLDAHLSRTALAPERIATVLLGASAAVAMLLGGLGLYGVMSDATRRRKREFAVRIALGAKGGHVVGQVVAEGMRLVVAGTLAGLAGSWLVARWLAQIAPADSLSAGAWLAAPVLLALAVVIASVLPARRAVAADPLLIMKDHNG